MISLSWQSNETTFLPITIFDLAESASILSRVRRLEDSLVSLIVDNSQTHAPGRLQPQTHSLLFSEYIQTHQARWGNHHPKAGVRMLVEEKQARQVLSHTDPNPL